MTSSPPPVAREAGKVPTRRKHGRWTEAEDAVLVGGYGRRTLRAMAGEIGRHVSAIYRRAMTLSAEGRITRRGPYKRGRWTAREDSRLAAHWGTSPDAEVAILVGRSTCACEARAITVGITRRANASGTTLVEVARLFGVQRTRIARWIAAGWLKAERSPVLANRYPEWEVTPTALRAFISDCPWAYDPRLVAPSSPYAAEAREAHAPDPWLTATEAGRIVGLSRSALVLWVQRGHLPARRPGPNNAIMIRRSDAMHFATRHAEIEGANRSLGSRLRHARRNVASDEAKSAASTT